MNLPEMPIFYWPTLSQVQLDTLLILGIICAVSILYCFIVGEITRNNSQMDKLWSILPPVYAWVSCVKGGFNFRLVIMAILATIWGIRLTINFGRKGAYKLKFWEGEEDYRWKYLRGKKPFNNKIVWCIFNFFFISIYQNVLVLATTIPSVALIGYEAPFNFMDIIAIVVTVGAITLEIVADEQQWKFQQTKWGMIKEGKKLEELPAPYNIGFNTTGLWNFGRHPNYLGEQLTWVGFYLFSIAAGVGVFNYSGIGALFLILLFLGSSTLAEVISSSKYPLYKEYKKKVARYIFFTKYIKR